MTELDVAKERIAANYHTPEVSLQPTALWLVGEVERLRTRLHDQTDQTQQTASQIRKHVLDTLARHECLPESLGHPIEQIVGRAVCDLRLENERLRTIIRDLESLCSCYRMSRRPPGSLLDRLAKHRAAEAAGGEG